MKLFERKKRRKVQDRKIRKDERKTETQMEVEKGKRNRGRKENRTMT